MIIRDSIFAFARTASGWKRLCWPGSTSSPTSPTSSTTGGVSLLFLWVLCVLFFGTVGRINTCLDFFVGIHTLIQGAFFEVSLGLLRYTSLASSLVRPCRRSNFDYDGLERDMVEEFEGFMERMICPQPANRPEGWGSDREEEEEKEEEEDEA